MGIKRYECTQDDRGWELGPARMAEEPSGEYVRYEDHIAEMREAQEIIRAVKKGLLAASNSLSCAENTEIDSLHISFYAQEKRRAKGTAQAADKWLEAHKEPK